MNHKSNKPIQYQQGYVEFYKLKFKVTPEVLIPRPESELLVDEVLSLSSSNLIGGSINNIDSRSLREASFRGNDSEGSGNDNFVVVDIGTGSGCIAIAIVKNLPNVKVIATDISPKALEVAKKNAKMHQVEDQIIFLEADLLPDFKFKRHSGDEEREDQNQESSGLKKDSGVANAPQNDKRVDVIVTNLPYIPTARLKYLDPMVTEFEPRLALDGGKDGFELYRKLFQQISQQPPRLQPKFMICEIDYTHGELAVLEALKYFPKAEVEVKIDLAKKIRILMIRFPKG